MPRPPRRAAPKQPHDALFQWTFSQREHAAGLLQATLPPAITAGVRWSTLRLLKASFVDRALRSRHSDLVFSAELSGELAYFYVILEHQRAVEPRMAFRMLLYMTRLWERFCQDHRGGERLPPILPIVVHHSDTGWTAATAFQDLVAMEGPLRAALLPHVPCFEMRLADLSGDRADAVVDRTMTALGKVALWCLSVAGDDARMEREIGRMAHALDEVLRAPNALAALEVLLRYLWATHPRLGARKVGKLLEETGPRAREAVVDRFDEFVRRNELRGERRGERRGELKGRAEARAQTLLELLKARFGVVPREARARIAAADEAALSRWTLRVLTEPSVEDVLDEGRKRASPARPVRGAPARRRVAKV